MAENMYFFRAKRTRFKVRKGKRAINAKTGEIDAFPPISYVVERPVAADVGVSLKSIAAAINKKFDLDGDGMVSEKEIEDVLAKFVKDGKVFTSRADLLRKTRGKAEAAEAMKVELLTEEVARLKKQLETANAPKASIGKAGK